MGGLDPRKILVVPFAPLAGYGRDLVLHWNPRQVELRGILPASIRKVAAILAGKV